MVLDQIPRFSLTVFQASVLISTFSWYILPDVLAEAAVPDLVRMVALREAHVGFLHLAVIGEIRDAERPECVVVAHAGTGAVSAVPAPVVPEFPEAGAVMEHGYGLLNGIPEMLRNLGEPALLLIGYHRVACDNLGEDAEEHADPLRIVPEIAHAVPALAACPEDVHEPVLD